MHARSKPQGMIRHDGDGMNERERERDSLGEPAKRAGTGITEARTEDGRDER